MQEFLYVIFFAAGIGVGYLLTNKKVIVQKAEEIQEQRERKKAELDNTEIIQMHEEEPADREKAEREENEKTQYNPHI